MVSEADEPSREETIRTLMAEVATRIRGGESRSSIRTVLLSEGLPAAFVDGLLAGVPDACCPSIGSAVSVAVSVLAFVVLPAAGAIAGVWAAWAPPSGASCGMWVFPLVFLAACAGLLGAAAGAGLAFALAWGLSELSAAGQKA